MSKDLKRTDTDTHSYWKVKEDGNVFDNIFATLELTNYGKDYLNTTCKLYGKTLLWALNQHVKRGRELDRKDNDPSYEVKTKDIKRKDIRGHCNEKLPTRMCHDILVKSKGIYDSFIESTLESIETLEIKIESTREKLKNLTEGSKKYNYKLKELDKLLFKLERKQTLLENKKIFYGGKRSSNKKKYNELRYKRLGCTGSNGETGGNSFKIKKVGELDNKTKYSLVISKKIIGYFSLKSKDSPIVNHLTNEKLGIQVDIRRMSNRWKLVIGYDKLDFVKKEEPSEDYNGVVGVDLNLNSIAYAVSTIKNDNLEVLKKDTLYFNPKFTKAFKADFIRKTVQEIVNLAKSNNYVIVLENLDFERDKKYLQNKLGSLLHAMPYKKIRDYFVRCCLLNDVEYRLVSSTYTSVLGGLFNEEYPALNRDEASCISIGLRGLDSYNKWFNDRCEAVRKSGKIKYRANLKGISGTNPVITLSKDMSNRNVKHFKCKRGKENIVTSVPIVHSEQNVVGKVLINSNKTIRSLIRKGIYVKYFTIVKGKVIPCAGVAATRKSNNQGTQL